MGFVDYFSRYPISPAPQPCESDKNYVHNIRVLADLAVVPFLMLYSSRDYLYASFPNTVGIAFTTGNFAYHDAF